MTERRWSVDTLRSHERVALDANVLIYLLDAAEIRGRLAAAVVDELTARPGRGTMATLAATEALTGAAKLGDVTMFEQGAEILRDLELDQLPLTVSIAEDAAWIRGQSGLRLADAVHLATANAAAATAFITNDRRIRDRAGLEVLYLDDMQVVEPTQAVPIASDDVAPG